MTDISKLGKNLARVISDNSPVLLTGFATAGVLTTALFVAKATVEATKYVIKNEDELDELHDKERYRDIIAANWKHYIPAVAVGATTIACIIGSHSIHKRRTAAIVGMYTLTETAFKDYKNKVVEIIGENKEQKVREEVTKDYLMNAPMVSSEVYITGLGEQLCYDTFTGRYFKSDIETIRRAQNDINARVLNDMYASHNDFYHAIGLSGTKYGDEVGWNTDNLMDIEFTSHLAEDGRPCLCLEYHSTPIRDYYKIR